MNSNDVYKSLMNKYSGSDGPNNQATSQNGNSGHDQVYQALMTKYNPKIDDDYISRFFDDANAFVGKYGDGIGYITGRKIYDQNSNTLNDLNTRARILTRYFNDTADQYENPDQIRKAITSLADSIANYGTFLKDQQDLFSQYDSEESYNTAIQQSEWLNKYKGTDSKSLESLLSGVEDGAEKAWLTDYLEYVDQEEKKNLDLDAYSREIATLEQQLEDYAPEFDWTDNQQRDAVDAEIQRIQKKDEFSAVANPESEKYDAAFDSKSRYVSTEQDSKLQQMLSQYSMGYGDLTYEYINNQNGIRDQIKQKASAYSKGETPFEAKGYDYMTEDEVSLYNYYYSMGGKASAEAYLETIQEDLNQRKAVGMYQPLEGKTGAEMIFGVEAGLNQFKSGIKGAVRAVKGDDSYVAPSATQYASGMVREDLADDGFKLPAWLGGASMGQVGYDAITTTANMAPSIAVGMLNPTLGTAALGVSAGGTAYQEALNEGFSVDQARGYGILSGASEIIMEKLLGGISAYGGNALGKFFTQNMRNADSALRRIAKEIGGSMLSEFGEEYLQEVLTPVFRNLTLGTDEEVKLVSAEALYAGFLGAITGGLLEGPQAIINGRNATQTPSNATDTVDNTTGPFDNATGPFDNATPALEKSTPGGVTEKSSAVGDKKAATESTVGKNPGKDESSIVKVGVSKMETVQQTADIESFAQQFGTQADAVRRNYMEGQDLQEYEVGFQTAYAMGLEGGKTEALNEKTVPYLSPSQRDIAFSLGRDATAQKTAETKAATAKAPTTKASLGQTAQLVAEDGSNGGTVTIAEIVSMDDSGMTLRLEDGRTVTDEDLDFPDGAEVYSTVMELGMDAESANAIVKASAAATIPRAAVAEGIETAYHYGRYGYGMDALLKAKEAVEIPESILQASYQAGEKRRQQRRETAQTEDNRAANKATTPEHRGKVHFHGESNALNDVQKESLRGLEWIADLTGAQIHVEDMGDSEGLSRVNGLYDPADDSIHIDLRAGIDGTGTLLYTAAHEFVHRMRQNNETAFYRLANFLVEQYGKKGISTDALVKQQMADAAKDGIELDYDEAFEEMVADAMEAMFTDTDALAKMEKLKTQDKSLWQEIKDFVLGLAEKIKAAYARLKPDSAEARYVLQMKESIDQIAQLFAEGVMAEGTDNGGSTNTKVKYSFAGRGSVTADRSALQQAEELERQRVDNETIRQQTGWYKGMDGQWRYEIDDSQMEITNDIINYMQLGELIQHEKLFAAYPDLADISVVFQGLEDGVNGSYHPQFDSINLSYRLKNDPVGLKDVLVHEIQHAIQHREGFTNGATAASWERKIKAGFDSRRAADIRKAQETERELRRIQEEEPEFYRDMVELDAMTPDLPRGEIDWETLEKIEDDPVEWQQYDARREELEAKYGDTKVWDMNDLLYQREQATKNVGRSGVELYFDTAGEIEARDASNRRSKSPEQRKSSPPRLGNEDTVFAESTGRNDQAIGKTADNKPFVIVERDILDGVDPSDWVKTVTQNIRSKFPNGVTIGRNNIAINQKSRRELTYSEYMHRIKRDNPQLYSDKLRATDHLDEIIQATTAWISEGLKHERSDNIQDFARGTVLIRIGSSDYSAEVVVGTKTNGTMLLYDILNLQKTKIADKKTDASVTSESRNDSTDRQLASDIELSSPQDSQNSGRNGLPNSSIISISNSETEVNQKFSRRKQSDTDSLKEQNQKLQEDVNRLKELVKLQGKVTHGKIMKPSSVEAAAKYLKKLFHTNGDTRELAEKLNGLYEYIASDPELTWEGVKEQAVPIVQWLQDNEKFQRDQYAQDVLDTLKGQTFRLDETQLGEVNSQYGSLKAYRKSVKNMASSKAAQSLDQLWQELSSHYPDIFPPDTSASDMPLMFADALERLEGMESTEFAMDWRMKDQAMLEAVYDSYWRVSGLETVADKYSKKIFEIRGKHYEKMTELRKDRDQKLKELRESKKQSVQTVRDNRDKAAEKKKIRKTIAQLNKLLNRGDKKKHVKDGMTAMVGKTLKLAEALFMDEYTNRDMLRNGVGVELTDAEEALFQEARQMMESIESGAAIEGMEFASEIDAMEQMKKLDQKLSSKMAGLKDVFARERKRLYGTTVSDLLGQLADEYNRLSEAEDGAVRAAKDENVYAHLLQLKADVGGTTVRDMTLGQMEAVADAFTMVLTTVRNANKLFAKNIQFKRDTLAGMVMAEIRAAAKKKGILEKPWEHAKDTFFWNNLKPVYAFARLGSETLRTLYQNIRKGQDTWAVDMQEADDFRREQYRKHNRKNWDLEKQHSFEFESGKVQLSLEQIMSLYAYSRREQALDHLLKGGFVFSGSTEVIEAKNGIKRRYLKKDSTAYNLTADELLQVIDTLNAEQKLFVEEMQTYLSDVMGGKGNEVSLQMYGIKSFGEKNYFPLRSAGQYMEKAKEDSFRKEQGQISIVNSGFTKAVAPKANNPITLDGFMDVWAEHVNDMSMYHSFVLPMEDFRRVYNYSTPNVEEGNSLSVNATIENAHGKAATAYIDQLYKDLNGGAVSDNRENLSKKLVGLHKKAAVFASASVVIQQPSAIVRAFAVIDPKHFIGPKVDHKRHKQLWEEVKKYAPVAFVKEMGYFDTGMGRSAKDYLQAEEYSGIREKAKALFKDSDYRDEILGKAPALADELAWCSIWEAVKRETKARNPGMDPKGDAFLQIAGERFSEVIDKTQVYDSVLSRSANMRSKALHMNMLTSFMAEPTTSINMLEDALRSGDRKQLKRTVGAVYGSVLLNSLLVSLVYAARDDDEDETYWEKYLSSVAVEMVDGLNPITYYPFLRDIWSIGQGFDVERADMSLISDFADAAKNVISAGMKLRNAEEGEEAAAMEKFKDSLWSMTDTVASLTGLPVKNIRRDIDGARNLVKTISKDLAGRKATDLSLLDAVLADVMNSIPIGNLLYGKSKRDRLYGAIMAGDTVYTQRLRAGYESDNAYHSAIKLALRENDSRIWEAAVAWNAGDMETYIQIAKEIRGENRFTQDDIVLAIRAEASSMEEKEGSSSSKKQGYFTAEKFGVAAGQDNTAMADMIRQDLIDTAVANGKTQEEAESSFQGTAREQLKKQYMSGSITGGTAEKLLMRYGGFDRESASGKVTQWQYEKDHPELDGRITYTQYKRWEADGKSRGVSLDLFTEVAEYQDSGTSGSNRSQTEVADYINRLPISTAQKDALWCCFWKESTLYEKAPWH